jgi:hypothetical protein
MSRLENKKCPFFKKDCYLDGCSFYDQKLDNCAITLVYINLYKLDKSLNTMSLDTTQSETSAIPFLRKN